MVRKKVKVEYIDNDTARKVTYKKRVKSIVKKTEELSVLCGVDACAIIYGPYDQAPMVWPSAEGEAREILHGFRGRSEIDQSQRRFNQQSFLKQRVINAHERLEKLQKRNREMEIEILMVDILAGKPLTQVPYCNIGDLLWVIDDKLRGLQRRITILEGDHATPSPPRSYPNGNENDAGGREVIRRIKDEIGEMPLWEMEKTQTGSSSDSGTGSSFDTPTSDLHLK